MPRKKDSWLDGLLRRNAAFRRGIAVERLPVARSPGRFALVTCIDPRINPAALGLEPFAADGSGASDVRVIRTIGGMAEDRSLLIAIHLAGVREIAFVTHSDCGNRLAKARIDSILESLRSRMGERAFDTFRAEIGAPLPHKLIAYLKAFDEPREAVRREVESVRSKPFVPPDVRLHGLVYDLETAKLEVVVEG